MPRVKIWSAQETRSVIDMLAAGQSKTAIAAALGLSRCAVRLKIAALEAAGETRPVTPPPLPVVEVASTEETPLPPAVIRDPCFKCGVRRDIGCEHTAWEKAA